MKSVYHERESVSFLELTIKDLLPNDYKDINNSNTFTNNAKKRKS